MKILHHANIYAPDHQGATAIVLEGGNIIALGTDREILDSFNANDVVDLQGKTLWPGLTDAHVHLQYLAESLSKVDCETATQAECLARVEAAAKKLPPDNWVLGHGWNQNLWPEGFGTAGQLDAISGGRPVYLTAKSLHAAWANSKALALAGIDAGTPDPPGGTIQRDMQGNPTGILLEGEATALVESMIPKPTPEELKIKLKSLLPHLWACGLTGVHDFDGFDCWQALQALEQENELKLRVRKNVPFNHLDDFIREGRHTDDGSAWLSIGNVKLFSDGALGPQTAAMLSPYEGTDNTGALLLTEDEIVEIGKHAGGHGLALAIHAIGDRANRMVLDAYEKLRGFEKAQGLPHFKHRIEHVQIISQNDLPRLAELDIIASVQPVHAPSDMLMADRYLGERAKLAYAYRSIKDSGAELAFGSDAPVEPVNPFHGIHAAVTRRRLDGEPGPEGWQPQERLSLTEALDGFSAAAARIANQTSRLGCIAPGMTADLILLDEDPFNLDPHQIGSIEPLATMVNGEWVYTRQDRYIEL